MGSITITIEIIIFVKEDTVLLYIIFYPIERDYDVMWEIIMYNNKTIYKSHPFHLKPLKTLRETPQNPTLNPWKPHIKTLKIPP